MGATQGLVKGVPSQPTVREHWCLESQHLGPHPGVPLAFLGWAWEQAGREATLGIAEALAERASFFVWLQLT